MKAQLPLVPLKKWNLGSSVLIILIARATTGTHTRRNPAITITISIRPIMLHLLNRLCFKSAQVDLCIISIALTVPALGNAENDKL